MKILYEKQGKLQVVPKYQGNSPVSFKVVNIYTEELIEEFNTLHGAEEYVRRAVGK